MKPVLQALILAELILEDKRGRKIIVGTFNSVGIIRKAKLKRPIEASVGGEQQIGAYEFLGGIPGCPYAYISLTDIVDGTKLELQFVSLKRNAVLFQKSITISSKSRLASREIFLGLPPLQQFITEEGVYAFEVVCDGEILGSSRIVAEFVDDRSTG